MDGSTAACLSGSINLSNLAEPLGGILYIEDFDQEPHAAPVPTHDKTAINPPEPVWTSADIEFARQEGRLAGLQAALDDAQLMQAQIQASATQSLADALYASQAAVTKMTTDFAEETVRLILGVLRAAIPVTMERHMMVETEALVQLLIPELTSEAELNMRTHPSVADALREMVASLLPHGTAILSVAADAALAPGDVQVSWRHGGARRDTRKIWAVIREAFAPLNLPSLEELCRDCGY